MSSGPAALQPTFTGHVATTNDALILFEACLTGQLSHVPRRPHDRERNMLIRSGCVFIYEENASGIKRWTDGVTWSPSRILGNFLVYRELDKPFPPGEKKRAMKKNSRARPSRPGEPYPRPESNNSTSYSPTTPSSATFSPDRAPNEMERSLIGSLVDSYGFKADGLVKKTMSVTVQGVTHHLVSYYSVSDVVNGQLRTPSQTENLNYVRPRPELTSKQSFRSPLEDTEDIEGIREHSIAVHTPYGYRPQVSHPGYLPPSAPYYAPGMYPPGANHPVTTAGYPPGTAAIAGNYMAPQMQNAQMGHRAEEYGQYAPPTFSRPYEPLNASITSNAQAASMGPATASPITSNLHVRNPPHHISLYPQASPQTRAVAHQSPVSMESRTPSTYIRSSFGLPSHAGQASANADSRRSIQASPILKHEARDTNHSNNVANGPGPSSVYTHERPHFYLNHSNNALGHSAYHSGAAMPSWPAPTAAHQHI
jgi:Gti1/Pac2 family transcription factor